MASIVNFAKTNVMGVMNRGLLTQTARISCGYSTNTTSKFNRIVQKLGIPEPPKKPKTGFLRFQEEQSHVPKNSLQKITQAQRFAALGAQWRELSPEQRDKYNEPYRAQMVKYNELIAEYKNKLTAEQKHAIQNGRDELKQKRAALIENKNLKQTNEALGKPKRPISEFFLFVEDKRKETNGKLIPAKVKPDWDKLDQGWKQVYKQKAQQLRDAYEKQLTTWEDKMMREGNGHLVRKARFVTENAEPKRTKKPKTE